MVTALREVALTRPAKPAGWIIETNLHLQTLQRAQTLPMTSTFRDRSPVAVLMDPKNDVPASERDMRLEDWLNDKIQASADLHSIASLIEAVDVQKTQLDQQVNRFLCVNNS